MYFLFFGFIILLPLFVEISILIEKDNDRPIFYLGIKTGRLGKLFKMLKFRTIVVDTEKIGGSSTTDDDRDCLKLENI